MSSQTTPTTPTTPTMIAAPAGRAGVRRLVLPVGIAGFAIAALLLGFHHNSAGELWTDLAVQLVAFVVLYLVVLPRALRQEAAGARSLAFGIAAVVLVAPAFWSGLPLLFGAAAALLGWAGRRAPWRAGLSIAGFALGLLGVIGYVAIYLADWLAH